MTKEWLVDLKQKNFLYEVTKIYSSHRHSVLETLNWPSYTGIMTNA